MDTSTQLQRFREMLSPVLETNAFYRRKLTEVGITRPNDVQTLSDYQHLPFTTKEELSADQVSYPPYGTNLTFPLEQYTCLHRTSGTTGSPLRWLDTAESWDWWGKCWREIYDAAGVTFADRLMPAFSFGPFIGFWSAYHGAQQLGALIIANGGFTSEQRIRAILSNEVTVLISTPTYALRLAEVAAQEGVNLSEESSVRVTIHAGEPGASLPATKQRIENAWGAKAYDHAGATEVGAWGVMCEPQAGVHLNENEFICEVLDPETGNPTDAGELVITNLGRIGMPVIRYRTGDYVKLKSAPCECGRESRVLDGGVTGRLDDALIIRGLNVYPATIENIILKFPEVQEFAVRAYGTETLDELEIQIESTNPNPTDTVNAVTTAIRDALGLRAVVQSVPLGTLPRYELKSKRFTDQRKMD
ncbi:phenylacetate--CoA ligase [Candidatus Poribacteria bacterium]|nr:phenylacetate--CoA ligase [Candidatus Poribacteria bacterium]MYK16922.1 phenylacetate--CoA ligase [Candidatus Poribacteria bacterium]